MKVSAENVPARLEQATRSGLDVAPFLCMKPIKLVIADVDGTLVTRKKILTPEALRAIDRLGAAGILFTITSGRPPRGMAMLAERLKLKVPIAAFNGGMIVESDLMTVVRQLPIPLGVASEIVTYLLEQKIDVWVYRGNDWYLRRKDAPHVDSEQSNVQFPPTQVQDLHQVLNGVVKIVGVSDDPELLERCESEIHEHNGKYISASRSQPYYLDITHREANKGTVVKMASEYFRIPTGQIAVLGDGFNDILMFAIAGLSIAMGNAHPEVQRKAQYVTTTNEENGFANAINRFIFRQERSPVEALGLPPEMRACLFDLDGVLTRTAKLHATAWKRMFDRFLSEQSAGLGKPFIPFDAVQDYALYVDGKLRVDGARAFLASRNIIVPEERVFELAAAKDKILQELLQTQGVEVYEGSVRYVRAARQAGLRTAVVSSSRHCEEMLESAGIADLFDVRVDGNMAPAEHLAGKPAPDTYLAAAKALKVDPGEACVFEDAISGVEAGRTGNFGYVIGIDRVGNASVGHNEELRRHGADVVVDDLDDLIEKAA